MAIQVDKSEADELRNVCSRERDYCAGFDCAMKYRNKLRNILNLQTQESEHMTSKIVDDFSL